MAKSPDKQAREKANQIENFLESLQRCARQFKWRIDERLGLRATHPDVPRLLCPIAAVWFAQTGEVLDNKRVYEVADKQMDLRFASLDLTIAADQRHDSPLFQRMLNVIGLKET